MNQQQKEKKSKEEKTKKDKNPEAKFRSRAREKTPSVTVFLEGQRQLLENRYLENGRERLVLPKRLCSA